MNAEYLYKKRSEVVLKLISDFYILEYNLSSSISNDVFDIELKRHYKLPYLNNKSSLYIPFRDLGYNINLT